VIFAARSLLDELAAGPVPDDDRKGTVKGADSMHRELSRRADDSIVGIDQNYLLFGVTHGLGAFSLHRRTDGQAEGLSLR
jgi:hypothetical protein